MSESPRVRRSIRRLAYWVFPVLVLIAAWQIWDSLEARWLEEEIARVFPEGIEPRPRWSPGSPPPANDAAPYYTAANLAAISSGTVDSLRRASEPISWYEVMSRVRDEMLAERPPAPADVTTLEQWFEAYELPFMLMEEARSRPYLRVSDTNVERALSMTGLIPALAIAGGQTLMLMQSGDGEKVVDSLIVRLKTLRHYDGQGDWYAASMKMREIDDIASDVGLLLSRTSPSDDALMRLDEALAGAYAPGDHAQLIRAESRYIYLSMRNIWRGRDPAGRASSVLNRPALRHLTREVLHAAAEVMAATHLPWHERITVIESLKSGPSPVRFLVFGVRSQVSWPFTTASAFVAQGLAGASASVRAARAALAIERYRRNRGVLPASLDELNLAESDRQDPFTGQSLRYARDQDGFTVYSVAQDLKDDGGHLRSDKPYAVPGARRFATDRGIRVVRVER